MAVLDLTPIEIASGVPRPETLPDWFPLPRSDRCVPAREALEAAILDKLKKPPCVISFSGGRDSSAALATATHVARREGLAPPIPATLVFPGHEGADEDRWQELVVRHLSVEHWERIEIGDTDLDLIGPVATRVLSRHGILVPPNAYFLEPLMALAAGGSFVTGWDGDGLFGSRRWMHLANVFKGADRANPKDLFGIGYVSLPRRARRWAERRRSKPSLPWLQSDAEALVLRWLINELADEPALWRPWVRWYVAQRHQKLVLASYAAIGHDHSADIHHFFMVPKFLSALADDYPLRGPGTRTQVMRELFDDILPAAVVERADKGSFVTSQWGDRSIEFTRSWDGDHVDAAIVKIEVLKEVWGWGEPAAETALLLQDVWLRKQGR